MRKQEPIPGKPEMGGEESLSRCLHRKTTISGRPETGREKGSLSAGLRE